MPNGVTATLLGGLVAGALDIIYICLHVFFVYRSPPTRVWQSVAAGLLGRDAAVGGGLPTALLGLGLHFFIAIVMAGVFVAAAARLKVLTLYPWITGPIYGIGLYLVMQLIVLPLSATRGGGANFDVTNQFFWGAIVAHTMLVGLPIALIARHFSVQAP